MSDLGPGGHKSAFEQMISYLGRYTHRVALSNSRLLGLQGRRVGVAWRDRADGGRRKVLVLDAAELLRRFLLHVLPSGFMWIRHYGFLASSVRGRLLPLCRRLLDVPDRDEDDTVTERESWQELLRRLMGVAPTRWPCCESGRMVGEAEIPPDAGPGARASP